MKKSRSISQVDSHQHDRFAEAACELGADTDALDRVFGKVVPPILPQPANADDEPKGE